MKKLMFLITGIAIMVFAAVPSYAEKKITSQRIEGLNRYETAIKISQATFNKADAAIIASGENYPDALVAGTLAAQMEYPIFLTRKSHIEEAVVKEMQRLGVKNVYVIEGSNAIATILDEDLGENFYVTRIAGKDRYETADKVNDLRFKLRKNTTAKKGTLLTYVSGTDYPDALAAAPFLGQLDLGGMLNYMKLARKGQDVAPHFVIGGPKAVISSLPNPDQVDYPYRMYGENRYGTAVAVAENYPGMLDREPAIAILASGENYPDALASSPLVASNQAVLLLTRKNTLPKETKDYLIKKGIDKVIILGGKNAVTENVVKDLESITMK
ncbi:MAG: cell wall-binding repeat-containing protein [Gallicola sp.]|nr:cell wall-binding repeat-containing protein [Gallicola sp.]